MGSLCRRCIELDIECFRLLEIIFGFIRKDVSKIRFYDACGVPKSMSGYRGGYRPNNYHWIAKDYGNGEMSLFLRIGELEKEKKETKKKYDALIAKSEQMEEYEEEIENEQETKNEQNEKTQTNKNNEDDNKNNEPTNENDENSEEIIKQSTTKKITKKRKIELSDSEN